MENNLIKTLIKYFKIFLQTPKDFLYAFTYSNNEKVKMKPYDPKIETMANEIISKLQKALPEATIHFIGATSLKILGIGDIDILIGTNKKNITKHKKIITKLYGKNTSEKSNFIEWKRSKNDTPIEIALLDINSKRYIKQLELYELLKQNRESYKELKERLNNTSKRNYTLQRMKYFNNLSKNTSIPNKTISIIKELQLLLTFPKNYLYTFRTTHKQKITFEPYDDKCEILANSLIDKLKKLDPELNIRFIGSGALKIFGFKDIDLLIACNKAQIKQKTKLLEQVIGKPKKVRNGFVEWQSKVDDFNLDVRLDHPESTYFKERIQLFEHLINNEKLCKKYEQLKISSQGQTLGVFERKKLRFLKKQLELKKTKINDSTKSNFIMLALLTLLALSIFALSIRGNLGNPSSQELITNRWSINGPFELSPERGRFALTYSIIEDKSVHYSLDIARFATPDLGYIDGNYVSLFAPTVSFIVAPGYLFGRALGSAQLGTFAIISIFAIINMLLIRAISLKLGAKNIPATLAGITFLFASPAFAYGTTLYQHHISLFVILLSLYVLFKWNNIWSLMLVWFLCALSISIDNPNLFMMFPIGLYALAKILNIEVKNTIFKIKIKPIYLLSLITMIFPIAFYLWFNNTSYGNPLQLSGTVRSIKVIDDNGNPADSIDNSTKSIEEFKKESEYQKTAVGFFETRNLLSGFYINLISPDRGLMQYTPVLLLAVLGFYSMYKEDTSKFSLLLTIILVNILLYSMWGDPWGGWAFGGRYLIPVYGILAIFLAKALTKYNKALVILLFMVLFSYSAYINTSGALTALGNPPKVEVLKLEELSGIEQKYTYQRNLDQIKNNSSRSFVFNSFVKTHHSAKQYFYFIYMLIMIPTQIMALYLIISKFHKIKFKFKK